MIKITVTIEADTEENLHAGLRQATRLGLPVSGGYVRASSSSPPASEATESPSGGTSVEEKLRPFLSPKDFEFLVGVVKGMAEPERRARLQERMPGKGKGRLTKFLEHVEAASEKAGLQVEDILYERDNDLKGASREVWIGPGRLLRHKSAQGNKEEAPVSAQ